ncbi:MAG: CO dehydrogenase/acetyl-CoA synthase subunit delta, partial [Promethearchaeota archaeon]
PYQKYTQKIEEIEFVRSNGTRVKVGGETVPHFYGWENSKNPNSPIVIYDVFDHVHHVPGPIKKHYKEVLHDPVAWGKRAVEKFGAELISLHFVSVDPAVKGTSPRECAKLMEEMLQAVKVPISIGCSGNKKADIEMFKAVAAASESERLMLSAADKETWEEVVPIAMQYDHNCLMWTQLDPNDQKKLNTSALEMGLPHDRIIMDPTTATLGYGLEYSFSIYQRYHLNGLKGDTALAFPMSGGTTNAWGAREAWMKSKPEKGRIWGDRDLRGPLWEVFTAISLAVAGLDIAMMFHPVAASMFRHLVKSFRKDLPSLIPQASDWITMNV